MRRVGRVMLQSSFHRTLQHHRGAHEQSDSFGDADVAGLVRRDDRAGLERVTGMRHDNASSGHGTRAQHERDDGFEEDVDETGFEAASFEATGFEKEIAPLCREAAGQSLDLATTWREIASGAITLQ